MQMRDVGTEPTSSPPPPDPEVHHPPPGGGAVPHTADGVDHADPGHGSAMWAEAPRPGSRSATGSITNDKAANQAKVDAAAAEFDRSARDDNALDATRTLNRQLEALPPELRGQFLDKCGPSLEKLTEKATALDKGQTADTVKELAKATDLAGPIAADKVTGPIARAIADGKLEQKGSDADGGPGGVFKGANQHNSEREFIDGVAGLKGSQGGDLFRDSLTASLDAEGKASSGERADRATGFAAATITGKSDLVPDHGIWTRARNLAKDTAGLVGDAVNRVDNLREQATDALLDKTLGLSDKLGSLGEGDSLTIGLDGAVSAEIDGEAKGEVKVTRNQDGSYTVSGEASLLGGAGALHDKLDVGGGGKVEFKFDNLEDAKQGTQGLLKSGLGALAGPSSAEVANLTNHISAIELDGTAAAGLDARFGLSGVQGAGAEGELSGTGGTRIEFENGKPAAVVSTVELKAEGAAELNSLMQKYGPGLIPEDKAQEFKAKLGFDPRDVSNLQGTLEGELGLKIEVRAPINSEPVPGGSPLDQVKAIASDPSKLVTGPPSASVTLSGSGSLEGHGVQFELKGEIDPKNIGQLASRARQGDLAGALAATGIKVSGSVDTYEEHGFDHELDLGVASAHGQNTVRDVDPGYAVSLGPSEDGKRLELDVDDHGRKSVYVA